MPASLLSRMLPSDGPAVAAIQRAIYPPGYLEDASFVLERAAAWPAGSLVVREAPGGPLVGYCQAYPVAGPLAAVVAAPPALSAPGAAARVAEAAARDPASAVLFVHEVSIHAQRRGHGRACMRALLAAGAAAGFPAAALVAVLGNEATWAREGFVVARALPDGYYLHAGGHDDAGGGGGGGPAAAAADGGPGGGDGGGGARAAAGAGAPDRPVLYAAMPSQASTDFSASVMTRALP